jgi:type I restriction enzyme S subunit
MRKNELIKSESLGSVLITLESGGRPKGGAKNIHSGIVSVGGEHLNNNGGFDFSNIKYVPKDYFKSMNQGIIKEDDVLIVKDGATTGKTSFAGTDFPYETAAVNEHVFIARANSKIKPKILFYFLYSHEGQTQLKKAITGSAQGGINRSILNNIYVKYPESIELQELTISEIEKQFTRLDYSIKSLEEIKRKLAAYRKSLLESAFKGNLTKAWRQELKLNNLDDFQKSIIPLISNSKEDQQFPSLNMDKLPKLPSSWVWCRANNICDTIANGSTPKNNIMKSGSGEIPFLKIYNLTDDGALNFRKRPTFIDIKTHNSLLLRSKIYPGDVLINIVGPPLGKVSLIPNMYPEWNTNQAVVIYRTKKQIESKYLLYAMLTISIMDRIVKTSRATAGQFNIRLSVARLIPVPLPPIAEQKIIVQEIESRFSVIDKIEQVVNSSLSKAELLRKSLLKSAFAGKLIVNGGE